MTKADDTHRGYLRKENIMFTFLLKRLVIACGVGIILILPLLFANTQHRPAPLPNKTIKVNTPRSSTKPSSVIKDRDTETPFQETEFHRTIINNNLFHPLGWRPARPKESFRLIGTRISTDGKTPPQAIIQATPGNKIYILTTGDIFSKDTTVTDIQLKQVTLEKAGRRSTLKLSTTMWLR